LHRIVQAFFLHFGALGILETRLIGFGQKTRRNYSSFILG
jgi:hypothetical protein